MKRILIVLGIGFVFIAQGVYFEMQRRDNLTPQERAAEDKATLIDGRVDAAKDYIEGDWRLAHDGYAFDKFMEVRYKKEGKFVYGTLLTNKHGKKGEKHH